MKNSKLKLITALLVIAFASSTSFGQGNKPGDSIYEIASDTPSLSILVDLVDAAGLDGVLDGNRNFTVFAPDNVAFVNLLADLELSGLLLAPDPIQAIIDTLGLDFITSVLLYHVAPGERFSGDVVTSDRIRTMSKQFILVDGTVLNGNVDIITDVPGQTFDIDAKNGAVHLINAVLLPPAE